MTARSAASALLQGQAEAPAPGTPEGVRDTDAASSGSLRPRTGALSLF